MTHAVHQSKNIDWFIRGIEIGLLLGSFLWTIETNAGDADRQLSLGSRYLFSQPEVNRSLASVVAKTRTTNPVSSSFLPKNQNQQQMSLDHGTNFQKMDPFHLISPQSLSSGDVLSPSFKNSPFYNPTNFVLLRFKGF